MSNSHSNIKKKKKKSHWDDAIVDPTLIDFCGFSVWKKSRPTPASSFNNAYKSLTTERNTSALFSGSTPPEEGAADVACCAAIKHT